MSDKTEEDMVLDVLALPRPQVVYDKRAMEDALKILNPRPAEREQCRKNIKDAFDLIEHSGLFFAPRSKKTKEAVAKLLAALIRAKAAKAKLPWFEACLVEKACDFETAIAFCKNEVEHTSLPKSGPPSYRQRQAVQTAYYLVQLWLVEKRGVDQATSLSRQSPWFKLSAILFGDKNKNLLAHMSRWAKGSGPF